MVRGSRKKKKKVASNQVVEQKTQDIKKQTSKTDGLILVAVVACFFLSGFAALLYQTAWLRQFSIIFGTSELAVVIVLAAYMAGLAVGAASAGYFVNRISRPVFVYGILEAGIAISALAVPFFINCCRDVLQFPAGESTPATA